jgi:hypothetical protein
MEDNNPTLWEEAYWNTAGSLHLPVNSSSNANANVMQMDGTNTTPPTAAAIANNNGSRNGSSSISGSSNTTNEMYMLYTAPGYRG